MSKLRMRGLVKVGQGGVFHLLNKAEEVGRGGVFLRLNKAEIGRCVLLSRVTFQEILLIRICIVNVQDK